MSYNKGPSYEHDATGEVISWVIIFILIIAAFPLGLYLLWRKSKRREYERSRADENQRACGGKTSRAKKHDSDFSSVEDAVSEVARDIEEVVREVSTEAAGVVKTIREELNDVFSLFKDEQPEQRNRQNHRSHREQKYRPQSGTSDSRRSAHVDFSEESTQDASFEKPDMPTNKTSDSLDRIISLALLIIAGAFFAFGLRGLIRSIIGTATALGAVYFLIGAAATLIASFMFSRKLSSRSKNTSKPSPQPQPDSNSANTSEAPVPAPEEERGESFMSIMVSLRELKHSIADIGIFQKTEKIEELTAKIFKIVEEDPAKRPRIERFLNYYLPTTTKLLRAYATFEKQGVKGENITKAKEKIARTLDTLIAGFELQLDRLFEADVMDIAAEINVLENLMKQDGLSAGKGDFSTT